MGQTDVVSEDAEVGDMDAPWEEWHEGVLSAERPAERAM